MGKTISKRQHTVNHSMASPARTAAGDAFSAFVVAILQTYGLLIEVGDQIARPAGQTSARWQVLAAIEDQPTTVSGIARALSLARQSVQRIANVLERDGLVLLEDNPRHRRAKLLRLTPRGRGALKLVQERQRPWANSLGARIGESSLRTAIELMRKVREALAIYDES
jgi:DNA-binding MarR family transcriptional regulator